MKKLKLVRMSTKKATPGLRRCPVAVIALASGENIKRGCGRSGMVEFGACLRCLYCGNYLYKKSSSLESMWFHFRWAREFWRIHNTHGRDFVNGVPVIRSSGDGESGNFALLLPSGLGGVQATSMVSLFFKIQRSRIPEIYV